MSHTHSFYGPRYWPIWLVIGVLWLLTRLPFTIQFKIGSCLGRLIYYFPTKLKRITRINIGLCYPDLTLTQQNQLVKDNFGSLGIGLIETAMAWFLSDKKLKSLFCIKGLEQAEKAFLNGKGILILSPHFTSLELVGRLLGIHYSFAVTYQPHKKPFIAFLHSRIRKKYGIQLIPHQKIRELMRALNDNKAVWYAYDIDGGEKRSVFAPFFNIQTASLTSVSRLVKLTNTCVIPISFYRDPHRFHYEITLAPPVEHFPSDDLTKDACLLNALLEKAIRQKPEQYIWQYKRFKTRPPQESRFY